MSTDDDTLIIHNVDLNLLENQRQQFNNVLSMDKIMGFMSIKQRELLVGLGNMLDKWSDDKYFQKQTKRD